MVNRVLFLIVLLFPCGTWAVETSHTETDESMKKQYKMDAKAWNLTVDEWTRYKAIMAGEGKYQWANADPITVLGIYAKSQEERVRYAEMIARNEYRLQSGLIALNDAYVTAFHRLYGDKKIMDMSKMSALYRQNALQESLDTPSGGCAV